MDSSDKKQSDIVLHLTTLVKKKEKAVDKFHTENLQMAIDVADSKTEIKEKDQRIRDLIG